MVDSKDKAEARVEHALEPAAQRIARTNPAILKVIMDMPLWLLGREFKRRLKAVNRERR